MSKHKNRPNDFDTPPLIDMGELGDVKDGMVLSQLSGQYRCRECGGVNVHMMGCMHMGKGPVEEAKEQPTQPQQLILQPAPSDTFTCKADITGCPVMKDKPPVVNVPINTWHNWIFLANRMETEWLAYFKGEQREDGSWVVGEYYFPQQRMFSATCEPVEGERQAEGTMGCVHSHVAMKAFFSSVDEAHFNHQVELVLNRAGDVECRVRVQLECGRYSRVVAKVMLTGCEEQMEQLARLKATQVMPTTPATQGTATQQTLTEAQEKMIKQLDKDDALWESGDGKRYFDHRGDYGYFGG
jgi:hypothetical protein